MSRRHEIASNPEWIVCPECDAPCRHRELAERTALRCRRCGTTVRKQSGGKSLQPAWAMATAGLFLVMLANVNPILTFDVAGNTQTNLVVSGVFGLISQGYWPVAALVFVAGIAGPAVHLGAVWYVSSACCLGVKWPALHFMAKVAEVMESWNLVPVYVVAAVVSVVKLDMLGTVSWHLGAFWILALSVSSLFAVQFFDRGLVERRLELLHD